MFLPTQRLKRSRPCVFTLIPNAGMACRFWCRAGKCLPVTATEVLVRFKRRPRPLFDDPQPPQADSYRFQLSPKMVIAMGATIKKAGERMEGRQVELLIHDQTPDEMEPYERLLGDAANDDPTLFARQDAVNAAWRVVDPILGNATPLHAYEPNTWGPPEVDRQFIPEGGWHNPKLDENPV